MAAGYLALILHAHLPFVRHPEHPDFLEEDWLFEAITETYIPLLQMMERLQKDGVPFRLTMSITPPLCAMLRDELLRSRYLRHLHRTIELARKEVDRTRDQEAFHPLAQMYLERFEGCRHYFEEASQDLIARFRAMQDAGVLEIITCGVTHGFLPLLQQSPQVVHAQILLARDYHKDCFGRDPLGIWLPECAYAPSLAPVLQEAYIKWFVLDAHGLMYAQPRPRYAIYAPVFTPSGPAAFARDRDSSKQVWSAEEGYPGDPAYRDFYRDIGYDLSHEYLKPCLPPDGMRKFTGIKYFRITQRGAQHKEPYRRDWAMAAAEAHATHFLQSRASQIQGLKDAMAVPPLVLSPFDAELFGHWWFEGPEWLELLIRKSAHDQDAFELISPSDYLRRHPTQQVSSPSASSWGNRGYWEVWLDDSNSWIYPHLHAMARRMVEMAQSHRQNPSPLQERFLSQLARELLLAQSSDWAFLMKTGTAREYATRRTRDHIARFNRLYEQLKNGTTDTTFLSECEWKDNLFPQLNWRIYAE
jgi:1,4-alpha-glucan branching enzyme